MFRIALLSRWHPHSHKEDQRYVKEFLTLPQCRVTCVWDRDPQIAEEWAKEYAVDHSTDLEAILSRDDVDGVMVTSRPEDHKEIFLAAARHKKHIFTEKVLSLCLEDAYAIRDAVKEAGIRFAIAFNRLAVPQLNYAKELLEQGILGEAVQFRCVCGHRGGLDGTLPEEWFSPEICGGGAMIDLGFNCVYLARHILGEAQSVSSSFVYSFLNERVEDNASCNVRFKNGAMGTLDATFTSPLMSIFELNLYGTKGAYYARFGSKSDVAQLHLQGQALETLDLKTLPRTLASPVKTWVKACTEGGDCQTYGVDAAVEMVKFMIAAYRSAQEDGKRISI